MKNLSSFAIILVSLVGCQELSNIGSGVSAPGTSSGSAAATPAAPVNPDPGSRMSVAAIHAAYDSLSCNSLSDGTTAPEGVIPDYRQGVKVTVTVPPAGFNATDWSLLTDYAGPTALQLFNPVYFSQINVPTRYFSTGFPTLSGGLIDDAEGNPLIEYFNLNMTGNIQLGLDQPEGNYEFAILADDGATLSFGVNPTVYASYPGVTPTRMICGSTTIPLQHGQPIPYDLNYFQGPRYQIASVLLMRQVTGDLEADPLCGESGNTEFFDWTQTPSAPLQNYDDLISRGWAVVPTEDFELPDNEIFNPCLSQTITSVVSGSSGSSSSGN